MSLEMAIRNALVQLSLLFGLCCLLLPFEAPAAEVIRGAALSAPLMGANHLLVPNKVADGKLPKSSLKAPLEGAGKADKLGGGNLPPIPPKSAITGSNLKRKRPDAVKSGAKISDSSATSENVTANLGGNDTLSSVPVSAFGFLPPNTTGASLPTASGPPATSGQSTASTSTTTSTSASGTSDSLHRAAVLPPANVVLDNTLGQTGQPVISDNGSGNDYAVDAGLGKTVGSNLFFSFSQFSLATGESATFTNDAGVSGIQNILARVTGGGVSNIDGAINVNVDGASLYLMNPAGFIFGPNASLNVPGSFTVTTADYIKFSDGTRFTALPGASDASLSASAVSAFGFLPGKPAPPAAVTFSGTTFSTDQGMNFMVVAGNQTIDGATLSAPAGELTLVSVAGSGEVPAVAEVLAATPLSALPALGSVTLQNSAFVSTDSARTGLKGHLEIDAGVVTVDNSNVDTTILQIPNGSTGPSSSILVRCQTLLVSNAGQISAAAGGFGMGGTIDIQAQQVMLTNGSFIQATTSGESFGGSITLTANTLNIDDSSIVSSAHGAGTAGNIDVKASTVSIIGAPNSDASGILAESGFAGSAGKSATGRGGDISVSAQSLLLTAGGEISATTFGPGRGGNVSVRANTIGISGSSSFTLGTSVFVFQSGILASSTLPGNQGAGGLGGDVTISTNGLNISNNGLVTASTLGSGVSGNVTVNASSIVLDGTGATLPTGIAATTSYQTGGRAGDIGIAAGSLQVLGGAQVSAATAGTGTGGNISVTGGGVLVSGANSIITAQTTATNGGAGGSLRFDLDSLRVADGGKISASTQGSGRGGSIDIRANQVTVERGSSSIVAETTGINAIVTIDPIISDISVTLSVQSTNDSRLNAILTDPGGNQLILLNRGEVTGANLVNTTFSDSGATLISTGTAPYTGTFQPTIPLAVLNGGAANGTWNLAIGNVGPGRNSAVLQSASLTVNGQQVAATDLPHTIVSGSFILSLPITLPSVQAQVNAGAGGSIRINAGTINVRNGGTISASTSGDGAAGSLTIHANSVNIDATHATSDTGFFASALAGSTGRGGSISISAHQFQLNGNAQSGIDGGVVARSSTKAPAGNIIVQAADVMLDDNAVISSANLSSGPAGSVNVTADNSIVLQGGSVVTVVAQAANAGTISLAAGQNVELHDGSTITASAGAGGGSILIRAGDLFYLDNSSIVATAGLGAGGNITIDPTFIILDHGLISANAAAGAGGNILIEGQYFFNNGSPITATGTTAGSVQISTLPLDVVNALSGLQGGFIDVSTALQDRCAMRLGTDFSSFLLIGRGGVEDSPDEPQEEVAARLRQKAKGKAHR